MNILILGSGGREHTFAWKISQSHLCKKLYISPGNGGTSNYGENIYADINNFDEVKNLVINKKVDLVLVEGFKQEKHPKIEVVRKARDQNLIAENDPTILAVATDVEISSEKTCINLNDTNGIANFIGNYLEL